MCTLYLDSANQQDYGLIHQRFRLYWSYYDENNRRFVKYNKMQAYWYRDETRMTVYDAYFLASLDGNEYPVLNGVMRTWKDPNEFNVSWTSGSNYRESDVYADSTGTYRDWAWIQPLPDFGSSFGAIYGDIYDYYGYITTLQTKVEPRG